MNCFIWYDKEYDWLVSEGIYREKNQNWRIPVHNGKIRGQNIKEERNNKDDCIKYKVTKFNVIPKYGNPTIPINSYRDQFLVHMIQKWMLGIYYIPETRNSDKYCDIFTNKFTLNMSYINRYIKDLRNKYKYRTNAEYII